MEWHSYELQYRFCEKFYYHSSAFLLTTKALFINDVSILRAEEISQETIDAKKLILRSVCIILNQMWKKMIKSGRLKTASLFAFCKGQRPANISIKSDRSEGLQSHVSDRQMSLIIDVMCADRRDHVRPPLKVKSRPHSAFAIQHGTWRRLAAVFRGHVYWLT